MTRAALILAFVGGVVSVSAQVPNDLPQFEVASVKRNTATAAGQSGRTANGAVVFTNMSLRLIVANAYDMQPRKVVGGPQWIDVERFDINARAPENTADNRLNLMLRRLLAERFRLAARTQMREEPVYALVLSRSDGRLGPRLRQSTDCRKGATTGQDPIALAPDALSYPCGLRMSASSTAVTIQGGATSIARLARALDGTGDRQVVDRTGLAGSFSFELRYVSPALEAAITQDGNLPSVFSAIQEQLGLKLESSRGPVEVLVIDSVERPTPD